MKQDYAPRISKQKWHNHELKIGELHELGKTRKEILELLPEENGFCPTLAQITAQMRKWELKFYGKSDPIPEEEGHAVSRCGVPEEQSLNASDSNSTLDACAQNLLETQSETFDGYSQDVTDHLGLDLLGNGCLEDKATTPIIREEE